jgi:hypothetical protein
MAGESRCAVCQDNYRLEKEKLVLRRSKLFSLPQFGHYFELCSVVSGTLICSFTLVTLYMHDGENSPEMAERGLQQPPVPTWLWWVFGLMGLGTIVLSFLAGRRIYNSWKQDNTEIVHEKCVCREA